MDCRFHFSVLEIFLHACDGAWCWCDFELDRRARERGDQILDIAVKYSRLDFFAKISPNFS